jgi:hypothetical protein
MDDGKRNNHARNRRVNSGGDVGDGDFLDAQGNASWFKEEDWFTFEEAMTLMECSRGQLNEWIREMKVSATFAPMTEGHGEWLVHWTSVMDVPETKKPPPPTK